MRFINNIYYSGSWTWNIRLLLCEKQTHGFTERKLWIRGFIKGRRATASVEGMPSWTMEKERGREEKKSESTRLVCGWTRWVPSGYGRFWQSPKSVTFLRKQGATKFTEQKLNSLEGRRWIEKMKLQSVEQKDQVIIQIYL